MDWSVLIAVAALLISVISPTFTSLVNNQHAIKMETLHFDQEHRITSIESYLRAAGTVCGNGLPENFGAYWSYCGEIYFYIPASLWPLVDEISLKLIEADYHAAQSALLQLGKELADIGVALKLR